MDRLPALIRVALGTLALACAVGGCEDKKASSEPPPSRVNAAKVTANQGATTEAFCDVYAKAADAKPLAWPALASGAPPAAAKTWRWINVWATWCKPCVEEMPRLAKWRDKLGIDLAFVSVDDSDDAIAAFRKEHPGTPASLRIADTKAQEAWIAQLGLPGAPPIPIHIIVDDQSRVRCVRAGGVLESDYAIIEKLIRE
ncbi:MAG TPA: TlpA disulfide reductase family protein [Kofleriaceae bacterium]|nr:TlpA disulfide reductase family protein [Kofleriaceae bacterium]